MTPPLTVTTEGFVAGCAACLLIGLVLGAALRAWLGERYKPEPPEFTGGEL